MDFQRFDLRYIYYEERTDEVRGAEFQNRIGESLLQNDIFHF